MRWKEYWKIRFSWKIHLEYWAYREEMLSRRADVIFERAYEIDMISNIYKHLLRMVDGLPDSCLKFHHNAYFILPIKKQSYLSSSSSVFRFLSMKIR